MSCRTEGRCCRRATRRLPRNPNLDASQERLAAPAGRMFLLEHGQSPTEGKDPETEAATGLRTHHVLVLEP